jgi:hypothetical protein
LNIPQRLTFFTLSVVLFKYYLLFQCVAWVMISSQNFKISLLLLFVRLNLCSDTQDSSWWKFSQDLKQRNSKILSFILISLLLSWEKLNLILWTLFFHILALTTRSFLFPLFLSTLT